MDRFKYRKSRWNVYSFWDIWIFRLEWVHSNLVYVIKETLNASGGFVTGQKAITHAQEQQKRLIYMFFRLEWVRVDTLLPQKPKFRAENESKEL